jgi:beta-N-acetylhexosaminidase
VADVPSVAGSALASRSFSGDPQRASTAVTAAVAGWRAGGVAATAKHFPGLGAARVNTDDGPVTIRRTRAELMRLDVPPFAAAVRARVPLVMVSHARYTALDRNRIASQSRAVIEGLLREQLRFRGVVITDSMEAAASLATGSVTAVSERAVRAGADLVLLTGRGSYRPVYGHLLAEARRSPSFRERVRQAAARVLALRAGL